MVSSAGSKFASLVVFVGFAVLTGLLGGCTLHETRDFEGEPLDGGSTWKHAVEGGEAQEAAWWQAFGDEELDGLVRAAFEGNRDLRQAWARMDQARAGIGIEEASLLPAFDIDTSATATKNIDAGVPDDVFILGAPAGADTQSYRIAPRLSYELDLYGRLTARRDARGFEFSASGEDVLATALALSGEVTTAWLDLLEQRSLRGVIEDQLRVSQEQLELVELRFSTGQATSLDVLQQRQQVAQLQAEIPLVRQGEELAENRLSVLLGRSASRGVPVSRPALDLPLPPLPNLGSPAELLERRPDLRAARARLRAADRDVAEAVADRYPRVQFSTTYAFSATRGGAVFEREVLDSVLSSLIPVFEGGRNASEVDRREARVRELLESFGASYLNALREVEDALVTEKRRGQRIAAVERERDIARDNLEEARRRYAAGVSAYLNVTTALQSLQALERSLVTERRLLLGARTQLYRALGGAGFDEVARPADLVAEETSK
jgi:outer membrane protein, multidrug efflux system